MDKPQESQKFEVIWICADGTVVVEDERGRYWDIRVTLGPDDQRPD